jgi:hypothetical protein
MTELAHCTQYPATHLAASHRTSDQQNRTFQAKSAFSCSILFLDADAPV